jgi:exodeoxyribonuclease VII large subunit
VAKKASSKKRASPELDLFSTSATPPNLLSTPSQEADLLATPSPAPDLHSTPVAPPEPRVWSISDLTRAVRDLLEGALGEVWVRGEICNFRRQASGHCYFGLKDENSLLSCVLFRSYVPAGMPLADGMCVQARGRLTVYEPRGQYQLSITLLQPAGEGVLQARFEALKRKLAAEGLFDAERKRPIPADPLCIGLVTSPTGAAIQDFLNIARRRAPWVRIILNPVRVQGGGAAAEIAGAIADFNRLQFDPPVDLIVACRGGGSIEDLWAFNEEIVARAIAASAIAVVSAVGHEIDFTIADFVADLRAPTPSAAAELTLPDRATLQRHLAQAHSRLGRAMENRVFTARRLLESLARHPLFRYPDRLLQERAQRLDNAAAALAKGDAILRQRREELAALLSRLRHHRPDQLIAIRRTELNALAGKMNALATGMFAAKSMQLTKATDMLRILSPEGTLARGYTITLDAAGLALRSAAGIEPGAKISTRFKDGSVESEVLDVVKPAAPAPKSRPRKK